MFRQITLAIAALAVATACVSVDAQAKQFQPPKGPNKIQQPGPKFAKLPPAIKKLPPKIVVVPPPHIVKVHGHPHYYVRPVVETVVTDRPVVRNTCNCLTKDYTADGVVIFKDLCTQETASAPLPGSPAAAAAEQQKQSMIQDQAPDASNFAGKTFEEFKAAQTKNSETKTN